MKTEKLTGAFCSCRRSLKKFVSAGSGRIFVWTVAWYILFHSHNILYKVSAILKIVLQNHWIWLETYYSNNPCNICTDTQITRINHRIWYIKTIRIFCSASINLWRFLRPCSNSGVTWSVCSGGDIDACRAGELPRLE